MYRVGLRARVRAHVYYSALLDAPANKNQHPPMAIRLQLGKPSRTARSREKRNVQGHDEDVGSP